MRRRNAKYFRYFQQKIKCSCCRSGSQPEHRTELRFGEARLLSIIALRVLYACLTERHDSLCTNAKLQPIPPKRPAQGQPIGKMTREQYQPRSISNLQFVVFRNEFAFQRRTDVEMRSDFDFVSTAIRLLISPTISICSTLTLKMISAQQYSDHTLTLKLLIRLCRSLGL